MQHEQQRETDAPQPDLDSLDPQRFQRITRTGDLAAVMRGIDRCEDANFPGVTKINCVTMRGTNDDEVAGFARLTLNRSLTVRRRRYPGEGWDKYTYLFILFSHMALAVVLVPIVIRALQHALRGDFAKHLRVVKWGWPIWMYVSVTGVIVYLMLYHLAPALHA